MLATWWDQKDDIEYVAVSNYVILADARNFFWTGQALAA